MGFFFSMRGAAGLATADNAFRLHLYQFHRAYEQDGREEAGHRPVIEPHGKAVQTIDPSEYEQEYPFRRGRILVLYSMVACPLKPGNYRGNQHHGDFFQRAENLFDFDWVQPNFT